jgi:uncharacterized protein YndB with AHSA1/START domain/DNA-binding transcriptional ArsR family regulator
MLYNKAMDIFSALAEPTRRRILEMLAGSGPLSATEISDHFSVSPPAISQHLKVLREAKLLLMEKRAQQRLYRLNPDALLELEVWARHITHLWNQRFDALERVLEAEKIIVKNEMEERSLVTNQQNERKEVTITRLFEAPRELVFKAWTHPKLLAQWWGPAGFTNPVCELDVRPGGRLLIYMRGPDGVLYPNKGTFHEVVPPERLVFTTNAFEDEKGHPRLEVHNTVTFTALGEKTQILLHAVVVKSAPEVDDALARMEESWNQSLERLAEDLAKA